MPNWRSPEQWALIAPGRAAYGANVEPVAASAEATQLYPFHPQAGTLWQDLAVVQFVDLDPSSPGIKSFDCGTRTYDTHSGHDVSFGDFREMDIGQPFFAALDGTIVFIHETEFDRNHGCPPTNQLPPNVVVLDHGGGHHTLYYHLRTGSVSAQTNVLTGQKLKIGDSVVAGQQLGLVGSSGCSTIPHLHFESQIGTTFLSNNGNPGTDIVKGQVFEPYGGACNPRPSNWVKQPQIPTNLYARDFYFSSTPPDNQTDQRVGSFVAVPAGQTKTIYFRIEFVNQPNGTQRIRFISPSGNTPVDFSGPISAFLVGSGSGSFGVPIDTNNTGTWRMLWEMNGQTLVDAPFTVVASAAQLVNHPPNPVTVSFDPPAPQPGDVIFCRVNTNLYKRDPDYDIMRYRYQWRVNGTLVRDVTSSVLSDALWKGAAPLNATVSCTVMPSDGTATAPPAVVSATINAKPTANLIVNSLADTQANDGQCTLREAIINANNDNQSGSTDCAAGNGADTISFNVTGTINLTSALPDLDSEITINGPGAAQLTVRRNTGGAYRVFNIPASKTVGLSGLTISNGSPPSGQNGGGVMNNGILTLTNCVITGNTSTDAGTNTAFGGGVYNAGALTVNNCQISGNIARNGGGLANGFASTATIANSTFSGNTVGTQGGGLYLLGANTGLTNCTISSNTATTGVGGIINIANAGQFGALQMTNCTITANNGSTGGLFTNNSGGNGAVSSLKNTLLAANSLNFVQVGGATLTSLGGNFDSDGTSGFTNGVNGDQVGTLISPLDAGLAPLGNYGGPTQTHALSFSSPAANAGNNTGAPSTDQRGIARPQGTAVDIGAFEANISLSAPALPNGTINTAYNQTLTASGGTAPYTFAVIAGALPNGLSLNSATGLLSGTPTRGGAFTFMVKATDANGFAGVFNYTLLIACPGVTITVTAPSNNSGLIGQPFNATFVQTGGIGATTFSTTSRLPAGLSLSSGGVLSGTPTQTGVFPIVVNANDSNGCLGVSPTYTLTITCLSFTVNSLGDTPDANPGNGICADAAGNCTLRAALMEANVMTACLTINFSVTGTMTLGTALPDIANSNLTLNGPGANQLTISGNNAVRVFSIGAGAFNITFSGLTIANGRVFNSNADSRGGGILNASTGTVNVNNCALTGNAVVNAANGTGLGGGILNSSTGTVNVTGSTLAGNSATGGVHGWGGGICNDSAGVVTITNSTLSGNSAVATPGSQFRAQGGAIANRGNGTINITNCTITSNSSTDFGGGIVNGITATGASTVVNLKNSIVAANTASTGPDVYRAFASLGFNLIGKGDGGTGLANGVNSDQVGSIAAPLDAKLTLLGNNGGPTQTHALLPGSPALDKGGPGVNTDQRGQPRPFVFPNIAKPPGGNGSDIGAFELQCATITLAALPNAVVGTPYSQNLAPSGGAPPHSLAVTAGVLPPALSLTGSTLAGTPSASGSFNFTVRATDTNGCLGERAYTLVVNCQTITVINPTTNIGTAGAAFSQTFTQTGGIGAITFSTTSTLPTGLSLSTGGVLSGTPAQTGSFPITVRATDANGCMGASASYTLVINCQTISVTNPTTNTGTVGTAFSQTFTQTGGIGAITFSTASTLPTGLTLAPNGALSGAPTQSGSFNLTVKATDANGCTGTQSYTLVINCPTITLAPATLPSGMVGTAYNQIVSASPAGSYTFAVTAGSLPAALSLNSATGAITGTPTTAGASNLTITATGSGNCTGSQAYTINIQAPCPTVAGISPTSGAGGNVVIITGTNLTGVTSVKFTNNVTANFTVISDTQIAAYVPDNAPTGPITVSRQGCPDVQTGTFTIASVVCVTPPAGMVGWWAWDGNANDLIGNNSAVLSGNPSFTAGKVGQALQFDGNDDHARVTASASLNVGAGNGLTIDAWINPADISTLRPIVEWNNGTSSGTHFWISVAGPGSLYVNLVETGVANHIFSSAPGTIITNTWQHVAVTYNKASGDARLYLNGVVVAQQNLGSFTPATNTDLYFGLRPAGDLAGRRWIGQMDEVEVFNRALSAAEIQALFNAGSAGKCKTNLTCPTVVSLTPTSGAVGNTVTITGTGFTGVSGVKFSGNVTATFTVVNDTTITATVPSGAVTGPIAISKPGCSDVQTPAFTVSVLPVCIPVSISTTLSGSTGSTLTVPIIVGDLTGKGVAAYDFTLTFDPAVIKPSSTPVDSAGTLSSGLTVTPNTNTPGRITVSAFGANALTGAGTLLNLKFDLIGAASACSNLTWLNFVFNEGTPCASASNGQVCIVGGSISGAVNYATAPAPQAVPGVLITAAGTPSATATTSSTGSYSLPGLGGGSYTVTPSKTGQVNSITSFDASLVARHVAKLITLTAAQQIAADASNNGSVTSFDASLIAQTVAGVPTSGIAGTWKFVPATRSYPTLTGDQTNQNFDAVLVGDVSGNWTPPAGSPVPNSLALNLPAPNMKAATRSLNATTPVTVSLPQASGAPGSTVTMPITVSDLAGLGVIAYDFTLVFDPAVLQLQSPAIDTAGTLSSGLTVTPNTATPGRLVISAFGANALTGAGTLLNLKFNVVGAGGTATTLAWQAFVLNEGVPSSTATNGNFAVNNLPPTLTSLNPTSTTAGSAGLTLNLTGSNFTAASKVQWNGADRPTTFVSSTQLTTAIPASDLVAASTASVTVFTPAPGGGTSSALTFTINNAAPTITSLSPASATAGSAALTLTVNGANFVQASAVRWNGSNRATTFVNGGQLTAAITAADIATAGTASVTVFTPAPGGGTSNAQSFKIDPPPNVERIVRVVASNAAPGTTVSIPLELVAQGNENALGLSLTFDPAVLSNPQAALGADASGAALNLNPSQAAQGRVGLALSLPTGQSFAAGTRQIVVMSFTVALGTTTQIGFGDQPIARELVDLNANTLPVTFTPGTVTITAQGYEADVTPRPNGNNNGTITIADWVQVGRFVAGLETAANGSEFQRADSAPRETFGDGRLTIADWVQAGRYASGLDPVTAAGGPTAPISLPAPLNGESPAEAARAPAASRRVVRAISAGAAGTLTLALDALGDENALGLSLLFNPSQWRFVSATVGGDAADAVLNLNTSQASRGRLGLALALPAGRTFAPGTRQLVMITFASVFSTTLPVLNGAGSYSPALAIGLADDLVTREVAAADARPLAASFNVEMSGSTVSWHANVSAASFRAGDLAREQIVSAFGVDLAVSTEAASGVPLPIELAGTRVVITDSLGVSRAAPLFFVSPTQINYQIPAGMADGVATVTIMRGGEAVSIGLINITAVAPALFTLNTSGAGLPAAVILRIDAAGAQTYEAMARFDAATNRFVPIPINLASETDQVFLILYGTGMRGRSGLGAVNCVMGGVAGETFYAGEAPGLAGVDQVNLRIPRSLLGRGEVALALTVNGQGANTVMINIK